MFILLIILVWIAVALIYALQFQICRDYQPNRVRDLWMVYADYDSQVVKYGTEHLECHLQRYSIFDWKRIEL